MILDYLRKEEFKLIKHQTYKSGEIIFHENDRCTSIGIVVSGLINISSITFEGGEIVYNSLTKGDIFGNNLIFSKEAFYRGNVNSITDSKIAFIKKNDLVTILKNNEEFLIKYLEIHSEFTKSLNSKIKLLSFSSAKERFIYYLFINHNDITFKNVTSLAKTLFLTREVTSRLISQMEKKGEIKRMKNRIIKL